MKLTPVVVVTALALVACGGAEDRRSTGRADACSRSTADEATIGLQWTGEWDQARARAMFATWDDAQDDVTVSLRDSDGFFGVPLALMGDDPPTVASVSYSALPSLVNAGAVLPIGDCLVDAGVDLDAMLPEAAGMAEVDGTSYGAPSMVGSALLLWDRTAFARAGIDSAPTTLAEVHDDAMALRERAGIDAPVAWPFAQMAVLGLDLASDDARAAAEQWVRLGTDGLLTPNGPDETMPPIGAGSAAMEIVELNQVWGYASAIANGQSPDAELGIAPVPGLHEPVSPVGGNVWVVSARASDDEIAAAIRLIAWATELPQQAALAIYGDGLPATAGAVDEPALRDYWHDLPLFRDAWDAVNEKPLLLREWTRVMGGYVTIPRLLHEVVIGSEDFDLAWGRVIELMDASETAQERDAETLFRCVSEHVQDERSPLEACT